MIVWAELKFPPINLWNIYPTAEMCRLHAEHQDPLLWDDYVNNGEEDGIV